MINYCGREGGLKKSKISGRVIYCLVFAHLYLMVDHRANVCFLEMQTTLDLYGYK